MAKNMKRIHKVTVRHEEDCTDGDVFGITSVAEILLPHSYDEDYTIQHIRSGGLWGIDCTESPAYVREVEDSQLHELRDQLHAIGFSQRAINAAFRNVERG